MAQLCTAGSISIWVNLYTSARINRVAVFCCCGRGGDTALPGGLHAGLCHVFLVINLLYNSKSYFVLHHQPNPLWMAGLRVFHVYGAVFHTSDPVRLCLLEDPYSRASQVKGGC